jgi:hypothetical protein
MQAVVARSRSMDPGRDCAQAEAPRGVEAGRLEQRSAQVHRGHILRVLGALERLLAPL